MSVAEWIFNLSWLVVCVVVLVVIVVVTKP
jgi:hypothetical protein